MKRRLTEIDLARIMHCSRSEMRVHLDLLEGGFPSLTYNPTRSAVPDLLNEQGTLIEGQPASWDKIEAAIKKNVRRGELEERQNLIIARLLYDYAIAKKIWSRHHEFFPLKVAFAGGLRFWWDLYFVEDGRAVVPFVDPRLSRGLSRESQRIVFSFMNERIRVPGSDFENCRLAIFQFPKNSSGVRELRVTYDDGFQLYGFDQLSHMVAELFEVWGEIAAEKEAAKRGSVPDVGGLFG